MKCECGETNEKNFYKQNGYYFKLCKKCYNEKRKSKYKTLDYYIKRMYHNAKQRNDKYNYGEFKLGDYETLKKWLFKKGIEKIWKEYVASGYDRMKSPSMDRIDPYKGYFYKNLDLGTWEDNMNANFNSQKYKVDRVKHIRDFYLES